MMKSYPALSWKVIKAYIHYTSKKLKGPLYASYSLLLSLLHSSFHVSATLSLFVKQSWSLQALSSNCRFCGGLASTRNIPCA